MLKVERGRVTIGQAILYRRQVAGSEEANHGDTPTKHQLSQEYL